MDFDLTGEQELLRETVRRFAEEEISPVARENDIHERFPRELLNRMASLGLLGGPLPVEYGGSGLDSISHAIVIEEIGRACSSLRTTLSVQISLVELTILKYGTQEQKKRYLPRLSRGEIIGCFGLTEPESGSDPAGLKTSALRQGDKWIINGVKTWISNGCVADLALVFAQSDKQKRHKGIVAFLIDTSLEGFETNKISDKLGLRASDTGELLFQDVEVPADAVLGKPDEGFQVAMYALGNGRYSVAAGCLGIISGCVDECVKYSTQRRQFGRPIGSFQLVQDMIARMKVDQDAARYLIYKAGDLKNKGRRNTLETSIAKYFASEAAMRAATDAIQVHGATGYSNQHILERYFRDAKAATIYEGTSQIQKLIIGESLTGLRAFT